MTFTTWHLNVILTIGNHCKLANCQHQSAPIYKSFLENFILFLNILDPVSSINLPIIIKLVFEKLTFFIILSHFLLFFCLFLYRIIIVFLLFSRFHQFNFSTFLFAFVLCLDSFSHFTLLIKTFQSLFKLLVNVKFCTLSLTYFLFYVYFIRFLAIAQSFLKASNNQHVKAFLHTECYTFQFLLCFSFVIF